MQPNSYDADRPRSAVTIVVVVLATLLWIVVLVELLFLVPPFDRQFADFRMRLPFLTEYIVACSRWCGKYVYVLPMPLAMIVAVVAGSTWLVRHRLRKRALGGLWCLAMLLLPGVVAFLVWFACYLAMARLVEGLAR